jgi:membrane protein DedA with SNARE-associated domain
MHDIETHLIEFVRSLFDAIGWFGVVVAMTMESACIPLPSEIIMPLTGSWSRRWAAVGRASWWSASGWRAAT